MAYKITPEDLSIFELERGTNNGAESYHSKLKARIKCSHPRIWNFMIILNEVIIDTDNEFARFHHGIELTRSRKKKDVLNDKRRALCKEKLISGIYTPLQFVQSMANSLENFTNEPDNILTDVSDASLSDVCEVCELNNNTDTSHTNNACVVCLQIRTNTWIFLPCRHANCCGPCNEMLEQQELPCPTCRATIENRFQIYLN